MNLSIRITEKTGDTERTIVIGEQPKLLQVSMHPIDLGKFLPDRQESAGTAAKLVKLDAKFQPVPDGTTDATWAYTHDRETDLVWTRGESAKELDYADAEAYCAGLGNGFRMPTIRERLSLVDYDRHEPAINTTFFDSPKSGYSWTSTDAAWSKDAKTGKASAAWIVFLYGGGANSGRRGGVAFVRAVRSGVPSGQ
jgi:hypothetical protein